MADKFRLKNKMSTEMKHVEFARRYEDKLQDLGRALVGGLYMLVRNIKLYAPDNDLFNRPLEQLMDTINTIVAMDGVLNLQGTGETIYLNNMLLRQEINSLENIRYLLSEFERHDIGGFSLNMSITISELRNFMSLFSKESEDRGQGAQARQNLNHMRLRRYQRIKEILKNQSTADYIDRHVDRKRYALMVYARAVYFMRKYLAGLRGQGGSVPAGRANRFIQDVVDLSFKQRTHFLGLTTLKNDDEYLCFHSVNVALLSVVFGSELGMNKSELRDLGVAALFHDIGKVDVAEEVWTKREKLDQQETRNVAKSPVYSVKKILRAQGLNTLLIRRIITAYEHKSDFGQPVRDLKGNISFVVPRNDLGIFSKVIAIVDCFDALTSNRPFREAYSPDIALSLMWTELRHKFDPELLSIFMNVMKISSIRILSEKGEKVVIF